MAIFQPRRPRGSLFANSALMTEWSERHVVEGKRQRRDMVAVPKNQFKKLAMMKKEAIITYLMSLRPHSFFVYCVSL